MTTWIYNVTLNGIVNQQQFQRSAQLYLSDPITNPQGTINDNFLEVGLFSSDTLQTGPAVPLGVGGITFATNNAFLGRSPFDTADEAYDNDTNTLYVGPNQQSISNGQNTFSSGGFLSLPSPISGGFMALQWQDNSIFGAINFSSSFGGLYQAELSGTFQGVI